MYRERLSLMSRVIRSRGGGRAGTSKSGPKCAFKFLSLEPCNRTFLSMFILFISIPKWSSVRMPPLAVYKQQVTEKLVVMIYKMSFHKIYYFSRKWMLKFIIVNSPDYDCGLWTPDYVDLPEWADKFCACSVLLSFNAAHRKWPNFEYIFTRTKKDDYIVDIWGANRRTTLILIKEHKSRPPEGGFRLQESLIHS